MKSQLTSMMFLNSSAEPFDPYRFYGKSPDPGLSKQFYQDNSLQKAALSKLDIIKKISQLEAKEKNLEIQTLKTAKLTKARIFQEKVEEIIQSATNVHNRSILLLHENATKIQKHVKGFLTRKRFEDDFIDFKEKQLSFFVNSLEILSEKSFFTLGTNTLPAILKIQKFYRRCCFNYKISKLTEIYQVYTAIKNKNAEDRINPCAQVINAKWKRFIQVDITRKSQVLMKVRRKLAIITIALYWKKRRFNTKSFKERILKVKRRFLALRAREAYQKSLKNNGNADEHGSKINEEDIDMLLDSDKRLKKLEKEKERKKRAKKLNDAKIAHAVNSIKLTSFSPMLQESFEETPVEKVHETLTEPTRGFLQKIKKRTESLTYRSTQVSLPVQITHKRLQSDNFPESYSIYDPHYSSKISPLKLPQKLIDANFTKNTLSFELRNRFPQQDLKIPEIITKPARQKYLNKETISFSLKRREIVSKYSGPTWNINPYKEEEYIPSLNSSSTPQPSFNHSFQSSLARSKEKPGAKQLSLKPKIRECSSSLLTNQISTQEASTIDLFNN